MFSKCPSLEDSDSASVVLSGRELPDVGKLGVG